MPKSPTLADRLSATFGRPAARRALYAALSMAIVLPAAGAGAQPSGPDVSVHAVPMQSAVAPGDRLAVAVVIEHGAGFHTWPNPEQLVVPPEFGADFPAIATEIEVVGQAEGVVVGAIQWPAPSPVTVYYTMAPVEMLSFHDSAVAYIPVSVAPESEAGEASIDVRVLYQSCDETNCYRPEEEVLRVALEVVADASASASASAPAPTPDRLTPTELGLFSGFDAAAAFGAQGAGAAPGLAGNRTVWLAAIAVVAVAGWLVYRRQQSDVG